MKRYAVFLCSLLGIVFLATIANGAVQSLPKTSLKIVGLQSHLNVFNHAEKPFWEKTVPEASGGAVTGEVTAQDLSGLQGPEILRLMKMGVIDLASGVIGYMAGDNPEFDGVDIPGLSPDIKTTRAMVDAYFPVLQDIMTQRYNARLLVMFPSPPQVFWCRQPVAKIDDLSGKKIRVFTSSMAKLIEGLGGTPVTMPFPEVTTSLERGVIDCALTGTSSGNLARLFEVTNTMYGLYMGWSVHFTAISLSTWNKLDPAVQAFLTEQFAALKEVYWDMIAKEEIDGIYCSTGQDPCLFGTKANMTYHAPSAEDVAKTKQVIEQSVLPNWADLCGDACVEKWLATIGNVIGITKIR